MNNELLVNILSVLLSIENQTKDNSGKSVQYPGRVQSPFWKLGKRYFVRTVTYHCIGELISVSENELVFTNASWVADSGRWHDALVTGELSEIEPFIQPVMVSRGCIVDATEWTHDLPKMQK